MRDAKRVDRVVRRGDTRRAVTGIGDQREEVLAVGREGEPGAPDRITGDMAVRLLPPGRRAGDIDALEGAGGAIRRGAVEAVAGRCVGRGAVRVRDGDV